MATVVRRLRPAPVPTPAHVALLMDHMAAARNGELKRAIAALGRSTGHFGRFIPDHVLPRLVQRRLMEKRTVAREVRMPRGDSMKLTQETHVLTAAGQEQAAALRLRLDEAHALPTLLASDPQRAAAMAVALGGLVLLLPGVIAFLPEIAQAVGRAQMIPDTGYVAGDTSSGTDSDAYSMEMWREVDADALSGLESSLSDIDSAIDSAESSGSDSSGSDSGSDSSGSSDSSGGSSSSE
jgi:uncharacterized membrane protein YgcG